VIVGDLSRDAAQAVAKPIDGVAVALDVTDPHSVASALEEARRSLDPPTIVANVAGWDLHMPFLDTDEEFSRKVIEINLNGPIRVLRATLGAMQQARWGRVINVASDAGRVGSSMEAVYSGAKGGLIAFTKTIAREFARYGVTANSVCPGPTDTPLLRDVIESHESSDKLVAAMTRAIPMRRVGRPEEVAAVIAFLAGEEAGFVTGQTISASGGLTMA
jgi:2-hydroxycyclohexanecarboxyl-CoA dehydrogenase